ncbi:hypothetical protein N7U49_27135 [Streptomyces sp. AD2-2]|nr:hypothetical protein N7U49_27135 [Streptomyces sp. AD2-2]
MTKLGLTCRALPKVVPAGILGSLQQASALLGTPLAVRPTRQARAGT